MEIFHLTTAQAIWDHLRQMFEHSSTARRFSLARELAYAHQGDRSVRKFATYLRSIWRQQDSLSITSCDVCRGCQCSSRGREGLRTFEFLMRLRPVFEPARSQIMNRDPIPSFDTVVSMMIVEETRMRSPAVLLPSPSAAVLAAHQSTTAPCSVPASRPSPASLSTAVDASSAFCRYCKKRSHLWDQCSRLL